MVRPCRQNDRPSAFRVTEKKRVTEPVFHDTKNCFIYFFFILVIFGSSLAGFFEPYRIYEALYMRAALITMSCGAEIL